MTNIRAQSIKRWKPISIWGARALADDTSGRAQPKRPDAYRWFWIGDHGEYDAES